MSVVEMVALDLFMPAAGVWKCAMTCDAIKRVNGPLFCHIKCIQNIVQAYRCASINIGEAGSLCHLKCL